MKIHSTTSIDCDSLRYPQVYPVPQRGPGSARGLAEANDGLACGVRVGATATGAVGLSHQVVDHAWIRTHVAEPNRRSHVAATKPEQYCAGHGGRRWTDDEHAQLGEAMFRTHIGKPHLPSSFYIAVHPSPQCETDAKGVSS